MLNINNKIEELENHINKLHEMLNIEDRITSSDFLCRLTVLEYKVEELEKHSFNHSTKIVSHNESLKILDERLKKLEQLNKPFVNYDDIQEIHRILKEHYKLIFHRKDKKPHKCPVCEGRMFHTIAHSYYGKLTNDELKEFKCLTCEGKGIVWG